jgi:sporulation protein YlmC with PRC-barrel domain
MLRPFSFRTLGTLGLAVLFAWTSAMPLAAADSAKIKNGSLAQVENLIGTSVRNPEGESLGEIESIVLDVDKGDVGYAVISFGDILGFGGKLFAVPWQELKFVRGDGTLFHFELDVSRELLERTPGFDKDNWPDFKKPNLADAMVALFPVHRGLVTGTEEGRLMMTNMRGKNQHAHTVAPDAEITIDGEHARLGELKHGQQIEVFIATRGGIDVATRITARTDDFKKDKKSHDQPDSKRHDKKSKQPKASKQPKEKAAQ